MNGLKSIFSGVSFIFIALILLQLGYLFAVVRNGNLITFTTVTKDFCFRSNDLKRHVVVYVQGWTVCKKCRSNFLSTQRLRSFEPEAKRRVRGKSYWLSIPQL